LPAKLAWNQSIEGATAYFELTFPAAGVLAAAAGLEPGGAPLGLPPGGGPLGTPDTPGRAEGLGLP